MDLFYTYILALSLIMQAVTMVNAMVIDEILW